MKKALLLTIVMFLLALPMGFSALTDGLVAYYNGEDGNDSVNSYDLEFQGDANASMNGRIGNAFGLDGTGDYLNTSTLGNSALMGVRPYTFSAWVRVLEWEAAYGGTAIISNVPDDGTAGYGFRITTSATKIDVVHYNIADQMTTLSYALNTSQWHYVVAVENSTGIYYYVDGSLSASKIPVATIVANTTFNLMIGKAYPDSANLRGRIDEIGFWNRGLSPTEISQLYNNGSGLTYPFTTAGQTLNISTTLPANGTSFATSTINFNTTVNSTTNFNCTLFLNGTTNTTQTGYSSGTDTPVDFNVTFPSGTNSYTYIIECKNSAESTNSSSKTFYVDDVLPVITNDYNNSLVLQTGSSPLFTGHLNFSDQYLYSYNITYDGAQYANMSNIAGTLYQYNFSLSLVGNSSGAHTIWARACDGHTSQFISDWNYTIKGNKISFAGLSITASDATKATLTKTKDRYSPTFEYGNVIAKKKYVIESTYPIEKNVRTNYKGWFVIPALERWIDFEDGTASKVTYVQISDYKWEVYVENPSTKVTYNSVGELNCVNQTTQFYFVRMTKGTSPTGNLYENQPVKYELNITFDSDYQSNITALLEYNNTNYTTSVTTSSSKYVFSTTINAPNISNASITVPHTWFVNVTGNGTLNNVTNSRINGTSQTVYKIGLDNCGTYTTRAINFSIINESSNNVSSTIVDSSLLVVYSLYGVSNTYNVSFNDNSTPRICISPASANFSANLQLDYAFNYSGAPILSYFASNLSIDNATDNIVLYLEDSTTQVTFHVIDTLDDDVADVYIKVMKFDVATNSYKTTQVLKSDTDGLALGQIVLNTVWYKFILELDGEIVLETSPTKITGTSKTFRITSGSDYFMDYYDVYRGITYSLSFTNATKNFDFTWSDPSNRMHIACLEIVEQTILTETLINSSCVESVAGTILLNIGNDTSVAGNTYLATAYLLFDDYIPVATLSKSFEEVYKKFGESGILASFLLVGGLTFFGIWHPIIALFLMIIGFIATIVLDIFFLPWTYLLALIILLGMAIFKLRRS